MGDLSAQGWSWVGSGDTGATSDLPASCGGIQVSITQDTGPEGPGGLPGVPRPPSQQPWAGWQGRQGSLGSVGHSTPVPEHPCLLPWQLPNTGTTVPCSQPDPGGCHSLGSPQRDPGAAQEPQEPGRSRAEQSSLTQAAKRQTPAPAGSHPELGPARREPWHHGGVTSSPGRAQRAPSQRPAWPGGWASPWAS